MADLKSLLSRGREWRLPVKDEVVEGTNLLSIIFYPAVSYAKMKAAAYPFTVPMQPVRKRDLLNKKRSSSRCCDGVVALKAL